MKENKTKPDIRFKGFTDDWEQRKLGELLEKYEDPVETPHDGYERLGIRSHAKGTFHSFVESGEELNSARMHRVAANKFILNITFAWEHAVAITDKNDEGKLVSHRFPQFSFDKCLKSNFFKYLILDEKFRKHLELSSPGGAGRNRVLKISDMLEYKIYLPSIDEQTEIGQYFSHLDNLITLHQRECNQLKELKKTMLKKMFPRDGSNIPEVRFAGFTDDWEQRKLDEVAFYRNGKAHEGCIDDKGSYVVVNSKFVSTDGKIRKYSKDQIEPLFKNEIAFVLSDVPNGRAISKTFLVDESNKYTLNQRVAGITPFKETYPYFLHILMNRNKYYLLFDDGVKQTNLTVSDVLKFETKYPSYKEQTKIGQYFSQLDNLITLHQRELEILKNLKKTCLKRMFI